MVRLMRTAVRVCFEVAIFSMLFGGAALGVSRLAAPARNPLTLAVTVAASATALACAGTAFCALVVLYRHRLLERGEPDLFLRLNASRDARAIARGEIGWGIGFRRVLRRLLGSSRPLVGDLVRVRQLEQIESTLDASRSLDGLPFMEEMVSFCRGTFRIFRVVDKVLDVGRSWRLRRMKDVVLLAGLRCDGASHGGCHASCYLLWKTEWLESPHPAAPPFESAAVSRPAPAAASADSRYTCQLTQLGDAAGTFLRRWDLRQDLRPLFAGNLTVAAFLVSMSTRFFNRLTRRWPDAAYPPKVQGKLKRTPLPVVRLAPGDAVRVLPLEEIRATLDEAGRNRGLFFDKEMIRYCGQSGRVVAQVERIIDLLTHRMVAMKTPCLVLESVDTSGEWMRFCAQHEQLYWRQVWLKPQEAATAAGEHDAG
jgi:hypothetical protein